MVGTMTRKTKWKAKERPKNAQPTRTKEGRKLVLFVVGRYFNHKPFNVVCMQIVGSNSNRRYKTNIYCQCNLPFSNRGLNKLKNNTNMLPEKTECKKTRIMTS